jgi:hypothetical protein
MRRVVNNNPFVYELLELNILGNDAMADLLGEEPITEIVPKHLVVALKSVSAIGYMFEKDYDPETIAAVKSYRYKQEDDTSEYPDGAIPGLLVLELPNRQAVVVAPYSFLTDMWAYVHNL